MSSYNFDEIISRKCTNSENVESWRPFILGKDRDRSFAYPDDEFIRMWVADMEFAVADEIREAISQRLDRKIFGYTGVSDPEYYEIFEDWCKRRYNLSFKREELVFSPGVIPALYQFVENLVSPGEKVLTFTPAYGYFKRAADYNGIELLGSELLYDNGDYSIDFDDFERKLRDENVKLIFFCNPHNPTGRMWTVEEMKKVADICEKYGTWVISDEIHCDLLRSGNKHMPMANVMKDYDKLITCISASKTFNLAGLMHSSIIIRDKQARYDFRKRDKLCGACNPLSIEAHKAAYGKGERWLEELKAYIDENLRYVESFLKENIPGAIFRMPAATYFAWINFSEILPDVENLPLFFADNAGVLLEAGNAMFVGNAKGFVRLNLAMPKSYVAEAMDRIKAAIEKYESGDYIR